MARDREPEDRTTRHGWIVPLSLASIAAATTTAFAVYFWWRLLAGAMP